MATPTYSAFPHGWDNMCGGSLLTCFLSRLVASLQGNRSPPPLEGLPGWLQTCRPLSGDHLPFALALPRPQHTSPWALSAGPSSLPGGRCSDVTNHSGTLTGEGSEVSLGGAVFLTRAPGECPHGTCRGGGLLGSAEVKAWQEISKSHSVPAEFAGTYYER